jgi:hypothetical protein
MNGVTMKTNSKYNMKNSNVSIDLINHCIGNLRDSINDHNKSVHSPTNIHKIILVGDSHIKGFASSLKSMLNSDYELLSVVKPGSSSKVLKESAKEIVRQLSHEDLLVVSSGTNDLELDNFVITFQNIMNYLTSINHPNILLLSIPFRNDLPNYSAVNMNIFMLKKKLQKLVRALPHTRFLDSKNDRKLFTNHGLHCNKLGKRTCYFAISLSYSCHFST